MRARRLGDDELLAVVASFRAAELSHADVVAAGRAAWTWRSVTTDLHTLLDRPGRPDDGVAGRL